MVAIIANQGLQRSADLTFSGLNNGTGSKVDAMGLSSGTTLSTTTTTIGGAGPTAVINCSNSRINNVVTSIGSFATGVGNFTINSVTLHSNGSNVLTGVYGGVDGQSITKTSDFSLNVTLNTTFIGS